LIRIAAAILFFLTVVWVMKALESVTIMVLVALFLAYLLDPAADRLEELRVPRALAAFLLILAGLLVITTIFLIIVPAIVQEITAFVVRAPVYFSALKEYLVRALGDLNIELPDNWDAVFNLILEKVKELQPHLPNLTTSLVQVLTRIFKSTLGVISAIAHAVLVPVLAYYFLVSFRGMKKHGAELIPPYMREKVLRRLREMDAVLSGFVRGQLTICLILACLYSLGFVLIGIDLPIVLGTISGLLFIVPYVGTMIGLIGGSIMAAAKYRDLIHPLYVVGWIALVQILEAYVLTPRIVGQAIGLHPVVYILALFVGGHLFGFVGMLLAVPVAAVAKVMLMSVIDLYLQSEIYQDRKT
jgi:predicted PurR-regulated permease PerM